MKYRPIYLFFVGVFVFISALTGEAFTQKRILILSWNVESGDNNSSTIANQLESFEGYDLIGLTEVRLENAEDYTDAASEGEGAQNSSQTDFRHVVSNTGSNDRMMIIWDNKRFELVGQMQELNDLNPTGNHRAPMFVKLKLRGTGENFIFMINHLARGDADVRKQQAAGLKEWAENQNTPIIAVGDYNFDYDIDDGNGNDAMEQMLKDDVWKWIRPVRLYKSQASKRFNSVLDFIFVTNQPSTWQVDSWILSDGKQLKDDSEHSDHRPVECRILILK